MFRRHNRIILVAGIIVAVSAAMGGPASARASAGAQASTPVPVDVTGDISWTYTSTPPLAGTNSGADKQTGTAHIDLTNVVNNIAAGNSSTYSITDNTDLSNTPPDDCPFTTTGSASASGSFPLQPTAQGPGVFVDIQLPSNPNVGVGISVPFNETFTRVQTGDPSLCSVGTFTYTQSLFMGPKCYNAQGVSTGVTGVFQGTYPNGTVNLGCSGTFNVISSTSTGGTFSWSVTGILTITPSCGNATASSSAPASSAPAASATLASASSSSNSCPVHYTVTIEQWIPQSSVADPLMPIPVPYVLSLHPSFALDPNCLSSPLPDGIYSSIVRSSYHGDGHADFGGAYRVKAEIEFDFDGQSISNFLVDVSDVGTTIRNKTYTAFGSVIASCSASATALPGGGAAQTSDTSFTMSSSGANPLVPLAPAFHAAVSGSLNSNGDLELSLNLTDFPSQGIQVTENGQAVLTAIASDVSCLSEAQVTGARGALNLALGLTSSHDVTMTAYASGGALSADIPSPLCSSFR